MNISWVIDDIKNGEGLETMALPFNEPIETVIAKILPMTVRTFSEFKPLKKEYYDNIDHLDSMNEFDKGMSIFILPGFLTANGIKSANAEYLSFKDANDVYGSNAFTVSSPFVGFGSYFPQDILNATMTGAAIGKFTGITSRRPTCKYLGHNKIQLFDFPKNAFIHIVAECYHDPSGETIPETCRESFIELATLDVRRSLYNRLKNMTKAGGAIKDFNYDIEHWSTAGQERKELVKTFTDNFYLDDVDSFQFF